MSNPGPAITNTTNYPLNSSQQALQVIGFIKGLSVAAAGDTPFQVLNGITNFVPTQVITTNANVTMATATVGIYSQPAAGGTAVLTTAALTGQVSTTFAYVRAATAAAAMVTVGTAAPLYANVGTTVANGVVDLYLMGFNVS